ncbi:MAG: hypothetical protein JWO69_75 [Thermoleophilia bacterium]|nr:hypothetical protein [Thermoleophilia bacterium]
MSSVGFARRAGRREANLRKVNERVVDAIDAADPLGVPDGGDRMLRLLCECALEHCNDVVEVADSRFRDVREKLDLYLVLPGHVLHEIEDTVETGPTWMIVRKRGEAARAARDELGEATT